MAHYCIGDIQGCDDALGRLLSEVDFSPSRDIAYLLGDLVNRGPDSAAVLRRLMKLGGAARNLLGNHDLHLMGVAHGARRANRKDTLDGILSAPDRDAMLDWLRQQHMAMFAHGVLMVHAGVLPSWTLQDTLSRAAEVEAVLRGPGLTGFLQVMYGNTPDTWHDDLRGTDRLRVIVNTLTRLRLCTPGGTMEFETKDSADQAPEGYMPWFDVPGRKTRGTPIAFGHWSTLGLQDREGILALDTGCVWGGCLTAARLGEVPGTHELIHVECEQAQKPGK